MKSNLKWATWFENFYNYLGRNICGTSQVHNNFIFNWLPLHTATFLCWSLTFYCIMIINQRRSILEHCLIKSVTDFKVILNCENWQSINFLVFLFILFFFGLLLIQIFDINVKSAFLLAKDVVPLMKKRGFVYWAPIWDIGIGGTIVNPLTSKSD